MIIQIKLEFNMKLLNNKKITLINIDWKKLKKKKQKFYLQNICIQIMLTEVLRVKLTNIK